MPRPPPASFGSEPGDDAAAPDTPPPSLDRGVRVCGPHLSTTVSPGMEAIMSKLAPGGPVDALLSGSPGLQGIRDSAVNRMCAQVHESFKDSATVTVYI